MVTGAAAGESVGALRPARQASCSAARRSASSRLSGTKRRRSPALSWPSFQRSAEITVAGHTKPPSDGPSGPRITGMSPVKSTVPTA